MNKDQLKICKKRDVLHYKQYKSQGFFGGLLVCCYCIVSFFLVLQINDDDGDDDDDDMNICSNTVLWLVLQSYFC